MWHALHIRMSTVYTIPVQQKTVDYIIYNYWLFTVYICVATVLWVSCAISSISSQHTCSRTVSVQALEESVADGKSELAKVVDAGHKLEGCTGAPPSSNLGYTTLEDRYLALKVLLLCIHHTHHGHTHSWTHSLTHSYTHSSISNTTWYIVASYYSTVYVHSKTGVFFSA